MKQPLRFHGFATNTNTNFKALLDDWKCSWQSKTHPTIVQYLNTRKNRRGCIQGTFNV